jgi:hypothetical protein
MPRRAARVGSSGTRSSMAVGRRKAAMICPCTALTGKRRSAPFDTSKVPSARGESVTDEARTKR